MASRRGRTLSDDAGIAAVERVRTDTFDRFFELRAALSAADADNDGRSVVAIADDLITRLPAFIASWRSYQESTCQINDRRPIGGYLFVPMVSLDFLEVLCYWLVLLSEADLLENLRLQLLACEHLDHWARYCETAMQYLTDCDEILQAVAARPGVRPGALAYQFQLPTLYVLRLCNFLNGGGRLILQRQTTGFALYRA